MFSDVFDASNSDFFERVEICVFVVGGRLLFVRRLEIGQVLQRFSHFDEHSPVGFVDLSQQRVLDGCDILSGVDCYFPDF